MWLANELASVINELQRSKLNVCAIVGDGAAVITAAVRMLNDPEIYQQKFKIMRIFCYCHCLNLIMLDIIKEFELD